MGKVGRFFKPPAGDAFERLRWSRRRTLDGAALFAICGALQFAIGNVLLGIASLLIAGMSLLAWTSATNVSRQADSDMKRGRRESLGGYRPRRPLVVATALLSVVTWVLVGWLIAGPVGAIAFPVASAVGVALFIAVVRRRRSG